MAQRKLVFEEGRYYHIFNRGVDKRKIFLSKGDLHHFLDSLIIMNNDQVYADRHNRWRAQLKEKIKRKCRPLLSIVAYALLPNHFHLIATPIVENGISKFMQRIGTSHTKFFNEKYERNGALFQGKFKAVELSQAVPPELMSVYVNFNYKFHQIDLEKFLGKTSIFEYLGIEKGDNVCDQNEIQKIINKLGGVQKYKQYLKIQSEYFANQKNLEINSLCFGELDDK